MYREEAVISIKKLYQHLNPNHKYDFKTEQNTEKTTGEGKMLTKFIKTKHGKIERIKWNRENGEKESYLFFIDNEMCCNNTARCEILRHNDKEIFLLYDGIGEKASPCHFPHILHLTIEEYQAAFKTETEESQMPTI